jgi:hypothetical protein
MSVAPTRPAQSGTAAVLERGLDTSNGLDFVRERLALVGKTLFLVSFGFYLFLLASMVLVGGAPFVAVVKGPVALGHLAASSTMGLLWLLARRARLSVRSLGALDAIVIVVACGFLSIMTMHDEGQILQVLLALTVTVMIRAILVPSRPGRTLVLSALAFLPTVVVCIARHHPTALLPGFSASYQKQYMTLNTVLWSVLGTTLATIISRVTYGLRQQVAEANELGQYVLEEKIGGGGMGEVWRARHRLLIRPAAIKLSTEGSAGGTPAFMAPEVVLGVADTDHRVDLYALGCVGYWLLTGKLIFEGRSIVEVMFHHAHTPPPRPSTTSELPIPAALEDFLMECLEKDPARRPASAEAVSTRLDAVSLESAWTVERAERWWAMHRPLPADARRVAEVLLSQEGRELRIGPRVRPRG